jgi:hypothetical protein
VIPPAVPQSSSSGAGTLGPLVAWVLSELSITPPHAIKETSTLGFGVQWQTGNLISVFRGRLFCKENATPAMKHNFVALITVLSEFTALKGK